MCKIKLPLSIIERVLFKTCFINVIISILHYITMMIQSNTVFVYILVFTVKTQEHSELVQQGDPNSDNSPLIPTNSDEMEQAINWCVNSKSGLSKQVSISTRLNTCGVDNLLHMVGPCP